MSEYLSPGIYVEEVERGPKPIEGVATSTVAFLGRTERGPLKPTFISSYAAYLRLYGGVSSATDNLPYAVKAFFDNGGRRCYVTRITGEGSRKASGEENGYKIKAIGDGGWGNNIVVIISPGTTQKSEMFGDSEEEIQVSSAIGFRLRILYLQSSQNIDLDLKDETSVSESIESIREKIITYEDFDDLNLNSKHSSYWGKRVNNGNSSLITLEIGDAAQIHNAPFLITLAQGADGTDLSSENFKGNNEHGIETGLAALNLDTYRDVSIVHVPSIGNDKEDKDIAEEVVTHCERNGYRFAVLDCDEGLDTGDADPRSTIADSKYAAYYYPWVYINDANGVRRKVPPGGFVCGIYARSDNTRGVWKAPLMKPLAGVIDLEYDINNGTQDLLNPRGVNCIRRFPGRGVRLWGARTLSSDPMWKYVNVRRLFIFIEHSIEEATQWVVFEPNNERLWARVKQTITLFLRTQWRAGALLGSSEEEAFSVNVGPDTMTEDDLLNGRLIVEVGIAPVRPAEFVIFRVFQKTQETST